MKYLLYASLAVAVAFVIRNGSYKLTSDYKYEEDDYAEVKVSKKQKRGPASIQSDKLSKNSGVNVSSRSFPSRMNPDMPESFEDKEPERSGSAGSSDEQKMNSFYSSAPGSDNSMGWRNSRSNNNSSSSRPGKSSSNSQGSGRAAGAILGASPGSGLGGVPVKNNTAKDDSNDGNDSSGSTSQSSISCSSDVGGGAYNNPISVGVTCSSGSVIKYCLSEGVCCDPFTEGTTYSSRIVIGAQEGNYCLSYYGSGSGIQSSLTQLNYNIDNTLPHLEVTHPKIFYQTTELSGKNSLASNDFGKASHGVGVLNLKSNDPGPAGMNLDCEETVTNYVSFPAPAAVEILSFFLTAGLASTDQVNVPLMLSGLQYGDNFITSYMENSSYAAPLYSCSTTKVTLKDFDYFQADMFHGETGTSSVREFSGGFMAYGFFEPELDTVPALPRGPAGVSAQDTNGVVLESGLFGVFY